MAQYTVIFDSTDNTLKYKKGTKLIPLLKVDPVTFETTLQATDNKDGYAKFSLFGDAAGNNVGFLLKTSNGNGRSAFSGDQDNIILLTKTIQLNGAVINAELAAKNFPNDTEAAAGGIEINEEYHTDGYKRVRIA